MISRRTFLRRAFQLGLAGVALGGYAVAGEPMRLRVQRYRPQPPGWPSDLPLKIAVLADLHACRPWMGPDRIRRIVKQTNAMGADLIVLLGDYVASHRFITRPVVPDEWAPILAELTAPLGVHAIMGNHDWNDDRPAQARGYGPIMYHSRLVDVGINVLENRAVRLTTTRGDFWLAGLGDQLAFPPSRRLGRKIWRGADDLPGTIAQISDDAPAILMAHEPDIFPKVPGRIALTLSGHTHGGQIRVLKHSLRVPSKFGNRYAYGHIREPDVAGELRDLIVSGGLGCSIFPVRFGVPPEIVLIDLGTRLQTTRSEDSVFRAG